MRGHNLEIIYAKLSALGLVRSKRHFSRDFLGRGWSYLRDFEQRDRSDVRVPLRTVSTLRARLHAVARLVPPGIRSRLDEVVAAIDRDTRIADLLGYQRIGR